MRLHSAFSFSSQDKPTKAEQSKPIQRDLFCPEQRLSKLITLLDYTGLQMTSLATHYWWAINYSQIAYLSGEFPGIEKRKRKVRGAQKNHSI